MQPYALTEPTSVPSPALLFYPALIRRNLRRAIEVAGGADRLRPHVKTHKTREIAAIELEMGLTKHTCATLAEAEMLAEAGAPDVLIAYPLVGPNAARLARLAARHPRTRFGALVDHPDSARGLSAAVSRAGQRIEAVLDLNVGQDRTGIAVSPAALSLYELLADLPGLTPGGLHIYDGHNRHEALADRTAAVHALLGPVRELRAELERRGRPVPRLVLGGTPTFPVHAKLDDRGAECSPGTFVLHDHGYGTRFPDLAGFTPAAAVMTRVVSRPTADRVTLDIGTKAVASDPPAGERCYLPGIPDYRAVAHNEEHLVVETPQADRFKPGDVLYAIPSHICPTVALYPRALVVEDGRVTGSWPIAARDRTLHVDEPAPAAV
ncbi:MAG TPA: D-TA family PLP-dependent enzyme [Gemmataceae bacterium]|nr:D-TA family PLP-dependent enzyme [Gemmataceae bacterium]